jgi:hypothetical protein
LTNLDAFSKHLSAPNLHRSEIQMLRFFAGAAAAFLLLTGAFLIWQSHAAEAPTLPDAPASRPASASFGGGGPFRP